MVATTISQTPCTNDKEALSAVIVAMKYARWNPKEYRRETWAELCDRNKAMHTRRYPQLAEEISAVYDDIVQAKEAFPALRSMQFGGRPIEMNPSRIYNCAFLHAKAVKRFSETMFLLLGGTGLGYSVQKHHVEQLPKVKAPESDGEHRYQIQDSCVGWSDAVKIVAKAFFKAGTLPVFDYRDIRDKGVELVTSGGKAPGPEPLKKTLETLTAILRQAVGRKLRPIEVHDMQCVIAEAVYAGGIRRAALLALFSHDDEEMLNCKGMVDVNEVTFTKLEDGTTHASWVNMYGIPGEAVMDYCLPPNKAAEVIAESIATNKLPWHFPHPERARANNSVILLRSKTTEEQFRNLMSKVEASAFGEPGIYWTNDLEWGANPCVEIALRDCQFCNLTTQNVSLVQTQEDLERTAYAAAFLGTLQAGYTDFHYLSPEWKRTCEEDALLGVSMTGAASEKLDELDVAKAALVAVETNRRVAAAIGINPAKRVTCIKPEGTASLVAGTASGIHSWFSPYYIRRVGIDKTEAIGQYINDVAPQLIEQSVYNKNQWYLCFPQKAPDNAITSATESMVEFLERIKRRYLDWIVPGHVEGVNLHNISCTVKVPDGKWKTLTKWMWENRHIYSGISLMPEDHGYAQAPFEEITKERYEELLPHLARLNIEEVIESTNPNIEFNSETACAGGACEITTL